MRKVDELKEKYPNLIIESGEILDEVCDEVDQLTVFLKDAHDARMAVHNLADLYKKGAERLKVKIARKDKQIQALLDALVTK